MQCVQKASPANGEYGLSESRTKQLVACVYMPSRKGMKRDGMIEDVSRCT